MDVGQKGYLDFKTTRLLPSQNYETHLFPYCVTHGEHHLENLPGGKTSRILVKYGQSAYISRMAWNIWNIWMFPAGQILGTLIKATPSVCFAFILPTSMQVNLPGAISIIICPQYQINPSGILITTLQRTSFRKPRQLSLHHNWYTQ